MGLVCVGLVARAGCWWPAYGRLGCGALHATRHVANKTALAASLRQSESQASKDSRSRLQRFCRPGRQSNGVVLLDSEGHIEWCNQIAASFGIDAQRDVMQSIGNLVRDPDFSAYYAAHDFSRDVVLQGATTNLQTGAHFGAPASVYGDGRKLPALTRRHGPGAGRCHAPRFPWPTVSHGFAPLTVPSASSKPCRRCRSLPGAICYLGMMSQQASRMQSVVQDLLTLSRLEGKPVAGHD